MSDMRMLKDRLVRERWQFARMGGEVFASDLRLLPDGRIGNYDHPNERRWQLAPDALEFCTDSGVVTTRFDLAKSDGPRLAKMTGDVLAAPSDPAGQHTLEPVPTAWGRGEPLSPRPKVAVFLRTHLANPKLLHLVECLNGSPFFDLFILADETRGPLPLADAGAPVISHSIEMCRTLGLKTDPANHENALWLCGDYALYCGVAAQPDYDYYFMIEYDVHFPRENPFLLEALINRLQSPQGQPVDLLCSYITRTQANGDWYKQAARLYQKVWWGGLFAFLAVSKRAAQTLLDVRRTEGVSPASLGELTHCEAFVLTTLMNEPDFLCRQINDVIPECANGKSFYASSPWSQNFLLGARYAFSPRTEIVHPMLDAEEYLNRLFNRHRSQDSVRQFVEHLNSLGPALVAPAIRERFLAVAQVEEERVTPEPAA